MFQASGDIGRFEVGYQFAAEFRDWDLTSDYGSLGTLDTIIHGKVVRIDEFWCTQRPMRVQVMLGGKWWRWTVGADRAELAAGTRFEVTVTGQPEFVEVWHG